MKPEDKILIGSIVANHTYIVLQNTSSVHRMVIPGKFFFTALMVLVSLILIFFYLKEPAQNSYEKMLYIAIIISFGGSILSMFGVSIQLLSYVLLIISVSILTTLPLIVHFHNQIRIMLLGLYTLQILQLLARVMNLVELREFLGVSVEILLILGIIYYNYSLGFTYEELFIVILSTTIGWYLGDFVYEVGVPGLILSTLFDQILSLGQYSIITNIEPQFFLSLHMAEVFNILMVQFLARRSWNAMGIISIGLVMTYPPILLIRGILILSFLRKTQFGVINKKKHQDFEYTTNNP